MLIILAFCIVLCAGCSQYLQQSERNFKKVLYQKREIKSLSILRVMGIKKKTICAIGVCKIFQQQSHIWTVIYNECFYILSNIYMILFYVKANLQWGLNVLPCIQLHRNFPKEKIKLFTVLIRSGIYDFLGVWK